MRMIALLIAALLAAEPAPAATAPEPEPTNGEHLARLKVLYDQSCGNREYGSYDDLCENLRNQIRDYQRKVEREARAPKPPPPKATLSEAKPKL
jgi:hypothetical protein